MSELRVTHLVLGLGKGGAETMLYNILKYRTDNSPQYKVVSLGLTHYYEEKIKNLGIELCEIEVKKNPIGWIRLIANIKKEISDADVVCSWMYGANLLSYYCRRKGQKLIWCIRHSDLSPENNSKKTIIINRICARLSRRVDLITYNGYRAKMNHEAAGYAPKESRVLLNGLDLTEFKNDEELAKSARIEYKIGTDKIILLSVARDKKIKDLPTFVKTVFEVRKKYQNVVGVMCGSGVDEKNRILVDECKQLNLIIGKDIFLLGFCDDVPKLMNMADVFVLHSLGEAFPNSLIQAMACETPVVSTDVGDAEEILNSKEYVSDPGDEIELSKNIIDILSLDNIEKNHLLEDNRNRVIKYYEITDIVKNYESAYGL